MMKMTVLVLLLMYIGYWTRLLRVPHTERKSILKEINPEYLLEGLMLKVKLCYFGHLYEDLTQWKRP